MKTYDEMTRIVLTRIADERPQRWKRILSSILKHVVTLILIVLFVSICFFLLDYFRPDVWVLTCE